MVQNQSTRIATNLAITSGTILTPDQYQLTASRTQPTRIAGAIVSVFEGVRDLGACADPLFARVRVTQNFDQLATILEVVPVYSPTTNLADADAIECYRARHPGAILRVGATFHYPLRPLSIAECLTAGLAPIYPTQFQYVGVKFIVTGTAFAAGQVQVDITPHVAPDGTGTTTVLGATLPAKMPLTSW